MKQNEFISRHQPFWNNLEQLLQTENHDNVDDKQLLQLPEDYRKICQHLSLAKLRNYSPSLQHRLNQIALRGHQTLYSRRLEKSGNFGRVLAVDFPRAVRKNKYYVLVSAILFFAPLFGMMYGVVKDPNLAYTVMSPNQVELYKDMYEKARDEDVRTSVDDITMFAYYIYNNISIALRTFASGLVVGIGAIFILLFNGTVIGAVSGILASTEFSENFYSFVVGHGSFELTAIVLAGACGMKLGFSILMPGRYRRTDALKNAAREDAPIVYGFVLMLFLAAGIEAFWSPNQTIPIIVKYWVGAALWLVVIGYLIFAGRGHSVS